jgi:uridine phosphorylase
MAPAVTIHLRPTTALAERALLTEDPGAAMALAQALLERPLMFNHSFGLWGYTGTAPDGRPLTVQSTGLGGASAAIVLEELIALGLSRAVRVGTCAALDGGLGPGELIIAGSAIAADGTSRALGATAVVDGDPGLTAALRSGDPGIRHGRVASIDLFYSPDGGPGRAAGDGEGDGGWRDLGALALDLETAALFAVGGRRGVPVACVLAVTDRPGRPGRIPDEDLARALQRAGRVALAPLAPA